MLAAERRSLILQRVQEEKKVIVGQLSKEYEVSEETIRRDLERLEEEGHVTKTYGGAVINEKSSIDLPFNVRCNANSTGKQIIADIVNEEIKDGDHIFMDASTTAVFIAKKLKNKKRLTIITNSIENMLEFADVEGWDIISTGGNLKSQSMSLVGRRAIESVESYNADKVFMSCKGIDIEKGMTDGNDDTSSIKQSMIKAAEKVYLVVDSSKFDKVAFSHITSFENIDVVITDIRPDEKWLSFFEGAGIECKYPL